VVLFSHGSGSSRHSSRNRHVARGAERSNAGDAVDRSAFGRREEIERYTAHLRFDIGLLAERLVHATDWLAQETDTKHLRIGYFGREHGRRRGPGGGAERPRKVGAIVSRGGRP